MEAPFIQIFRSVSLSHSVHKITSLFVYRAILYVMHGTFAHFKDMPQIIMFYYKIEIYVFNSTSGLESRKIKFLF